MKHCKNKYINLIIVLSITIIVVLLGSYWKFFLPFSWRATYSNFKLDWWIFYIAILYGIASIVVFVVNYKLPINQGESKHIFALKVLFVKFVVFIVVLIAYIIAFLIIIAGVACIDIYFNGFDSGVFSMTAIVLCFSLYVSNGFLCQ